jgi:uncharacterized protein
MTGNPSSLNDRYQRLLTSLRSLATEHHGLIVAYSGGVDSALLLAAGAEALKTLEDAPPLYALTAISPSYPDWEREPARALAEELGAQYVEVETDELTRDEYRANDGQRCYHCKAALFDVATLMREVSEDQESQFDSLRGALVYGAILDDLGDHRPGMQAAQDRGVGAPLIDAKLSKSDVRALSHRLGLPTWDKPASACLASRFPYGTEVTAERLTQIGRCEARLLALGILIVRARYHGDLVRLELGELELERVLADAALRREVTRSCKEVGFKYVSIDLEGYRSGSANEALVVIQ